MLVFIAVSELAGRLFVFEDDADGSISVDNGVVDEGVPCLVAVCEWWQSGEVEVDFDGLCSAVAQIVDLVGDMLVLGLELAVSGFELVVAAVVVVGVVGCGCCGGDELVHQRDRFFDPHNPSKQLGRIYERAFNSCSITSSPGAVPE